MPDKTGMSKPMNIIISPRFKIKTFPFLSWITPIGIDSKPNIRYPKNGSNVATVMERTKDSLARLTIGPAASTIPIERNIRYMGKNFLTLILKYFS
jgi:hypothetical protein